jgi:DNA-binding LacI/PurR family transcriptional regulator
VPNNGVGIGARSMEELREELLGTLRAAGLRRGAVVPSLREISGRFGVTKAAAERAVRSLVADGVCYTEPGRGAFMAVDSAELVETSTLAFVFGVYEYPRTGVLFYRHVYEGMQEWIFGAGHNVVKFYEWRQKSRLQKTREWARFADRVAGVGVLGVYEDADCMMLRNSGLPVVVVDYDTHSLGIDCAVLDCAGSMRRLGRALLERGAGDLFFVRAAWGATSQDPASEERRRGLKTAAGEAGLTLDAEHVTGLDGGNEKADLERLAARLGDLRAGGKLGAVVCEDGGLVARLTAALGDRRLAAGRDFLLGYTSALTPAEEIAAHPAVLAAFDFRRLGEMGGELLGERLKNGPGRPVRAVLKERIVDWDPAKAGPGGK